MSNLSDFRSFKNTSKKEILMMYGGVDSRVFEEWIAPIKTEIGWRKGRQTFPPRVVERITQHLGIPFEIRLPK